MRDFLYNLATDKTGGFFAAVIKFFLFLLSLVYGLIIRGLSWVNSLKPFQLHCKVISVGNITLGGTGKTALVEYVARCLRSQGHKVAILSRGYKRKLNQMGDEPFMLQSKLKDIPVIVDADRARGIKRAVCDYAADTVILDDGFQQWRIKKDLDIVTIDTTQPFGNQQMLPRGILREPIRSLKRAGIFVLTKTNLNPNVEDVEEFLQEINPQAQIIESGHYPAGLYKLYNNEEAVGLDILQGKIVNLFCGIADPDSFENLVASLGAKIEKSFRFPDHYDYSEEDLKNIIRESEKRNVAAIVTTEKDAARINKSQVSTVGGSAYGGISHKPQVLVLRIELKITKNEEALHTRLLRLYSP